MVLPAGGHPIRFGVCDQPHKIQSRAVLGAGALGGAITDEIRLHVYSSCQGRDGGNCSPLSA